MIPLVPKYHKLGEGFSLREESEAMVHPGRRTDGSQSAPTWILDLVDLKKAILLCSICRIHFNPRYHHYRRVVIIGCSGFNGMCDACKQQTINVGGGALFQPEEQYEQVNVEPSQIRRRHREASRRAWSPWEAIQRR